MRITLQIAAILAGGIFLAAVAQVPQGTQLRSSGKRRPAMTSYRDTPEGKKLDYVVSGSSVKNSPQAVQIDDFELKSFHNGDPKLTNFIAQAPHCEMDTANNIASDPGPVQIFTPTTNLYVEGVGFNFTQSNHFLVISNQVKTRVVKSLLKSSFLAAQGTNANAATGQVIKIFADRGEFDLNSNVVDYLGNVHMIDPQLDLTSDFLTIRFTTNGEVESMLARRNVVLTSTNNGRATGLTGLYYRTNGEEIMKLTTDAAWRNGDQSAKAHEFVYYSVRHFLTGSGDVHVLWPQEQTNTAGTNGFRELFADFATLQFPPTNGPVQHIHAQGNVIIVNDIDHSRAMADQAEYDRKTDIVELTGHPDWWNNQIEVRAQTLTADLAGKIYHARRDAHFKMRTGGANTGQPEAIPGHATNQWIFISSDTIEYQTNQAVFFNNVETRVLQNDRLQEKLNCSLLTIDLTNNQMRNAFASGDVRGETAPDAHGVVKTISCQQLNAYRSAQTALLKTVDAYTNVVIKEYGLDATAPSNKLTADTVHARFSPVTNQIEHAIALRHVVFDQFKVGQTTHATSDRADYTAGTNDFVKLTGTPLAHNDKYDITDADFMIWLPKSNKFQAFGQYTIIPIKHGSGGKSM